MRSNLIAFFSLIAFLTSLPAAEPTPRKWTVDGVERDGLVYIPSQAKETATPLVFVFHGHGGTARNASRSIDIHTHWPEAIVVYLQGLNTVGQLTDPEGKKPGWQASAGDQSNRDLKFFDEVLKSLKADYKVDPKRIYCTGHSNGGGFTYLLWSERGDTFAAMAPSASVANTKKFKLTPKPVMHFAGEKDTLVKFEWQMAGIEELKKINGCDKESKPWEPSKLAKLYPSKTDTPVIAYIHSGAHVFPKEAPALIVKFFQEYPKK